MSVVRWIGFVQERGGNESHIASSATLTVIAIYGLSGAFNVILLLVTRPNSILFGRRREDHTEGRAPSPSLDRHHSGDHPKQEATESTAGGHDVELGRLPSRSSGSVWQGRS